MATDNVALRTESKATRIKVFCLECGKKFTCGPFSVPSCPKCGGSDIDIREDV